MMLIGLCGYAQSGKNTTANILTELAGFKQVGFADAIRSMALGINPVVSWGHYTREPIYYADVLRDFGYEGAKREFPELRRFLQRLGTEGMREHFGPYVWVNLTAARIATIIGPVVVTDVRFDNEAQYIRNAGGVLWRIRRPGVTSVNAHESDRYADKFEVSEEITASSLDELRAAVVAAWGRLR
jgi:hypothetical protein